MLTVAKGKPQSVVRFALKFTPSLALNLNSIFLEKFSKEIVKQLSVESLLEAFC